MLLKKEKSQFLQKIKLKQLEPAKKNMDMLPKISPKNLKSLMRRKKQMMENTIFQINSRNQYTSHQMEVSLQKLMQGMKDSWVQKCFSIQNSFIKTGKLHQMRLLIILFKLVQWIIEDVCIKISFSLVEVPYLMDLTPSWVSQYKKELMIDWRHIKP